MKCHLGSFWGTCRRGAFCLVVSCLSSVGFAQENAANRSYPTGLRPPTPAERDWMDKQLKKVRKVRLNRLGLERVNQHRRSSGLAPLALPVAPEGGEVVGQGAPEGEADASPVFEAELASSGPGGSGLPAAVDNSALPSFPPVRSQGSIGSCASFSTTYYAATHMLGLARGFNNKNDGDNSTKLSPKWTYAMVNGGQDNGSWFTPTFDVLIRDGGATWADWPYSGVNTPSSYREWCRDGAVWRRAIQYRMSEAGTVENVDTPAGLNDLRTLLANGYVLLYATDIYGWQFTTIADDLSTSEDNAMVGKRICYYVAAEASGHAMTVVGYNDNLWCDINKNGVVDPGEKGALRICNSWGSTWLPGNAGPGDGGFTWLAYDALRSVSAVPGASTPNRVPGSLGAGRTAWWFNEAYWLTARAAYTPQLLAQLTLNHPARNQLQIKLGRSPASASTPSVYWTPAALQFQGGAFGFDGTTVAAPGTFVLDLSDIAAGGLNRYYLAVTDSASGSPASVSDFRLTDAGGNLVAAASSGIPGTADNTTALAYADLSLSLPTVLNGGETNALLGVSFSFTIQATGNPTSFGAVGLPPGLAINTANGRIAGTPTQAGTFVVSLSANNPSGTGGGSLTITVGGSVTPPPTITSASSAVGAVGALFSYTITASGGPTGFGASELPAGLGIETSSGLISGTPTQPGVFPVQLSANNSGGTGTRSLTLTISPAQDDVPIITSAGTAQARVGSLFTYRITAANNPTSFFADGLPRELGVNTVTGVISGTPSLARDHTITLRAGNELGAGFATLLLSVVGDSSFGPANDAFANRSALAGADVTVTGGNNNATAEAGEPAHAGNSASRSVWWTWTAPADGTATISTTGSDFDTVLAVYRGAQVAGLTPVAADDQSGANNTSRASFNATAGTAYAIAVDGSGGAVGNITLRVQWVGTSTAPPNDNFASRGVLSGLSVAVTGRTVGATAQAGEPAHAGSPAAKSVWWTWTAPQSGGVRVSTAGSDFDTVLAIYTGSAVGSLSSMASDDQSGGANTSALTFNAAAGATYQLAVDGYLGAAGNVALALQFVGGGASPPNDDFANRLPLTGANPSATGSNVNATAQAGEWPHSGQPATKSVWWTWTAGISGLVNVDTAGSGFDTILAVYAGSTLATLSPVAANDDADGLLTSRASFSAQAGATYQIAVDGFSGESGSVVLHLRTQSAAPANDQFAAGAVLAGSSPAASGANVNATVQLGEPTHAGNFPSHSVWWFWTAPGNGLVSFNTAGSSFDTLLAIYTGSAVNALTYVASNDDGPGDWTSAVSFWANAGTTYRIAVDGFQGASGNILLSGHQRPAGDLLYGTDFESFYYGDDTLVGADGWEGYQLSPGVQGAINGFTGLGRGAYLGYTAPLANSVSVYRPLNFQPIAQGRPVVTFATTMAIMDSNNGFYDSFVFSFYNRSEQLLAAIIFDNSNLAIYYDDRSGSEFNTGWKFRNNIYDWLVVTVDFAANTWSATLGNSPIFTNRRFHGGTAARDLGEVSVDWIVSGPSLAGNNYVLFDNYSVAASAALTPPVITAQPQSRTNSAGSLANFSVTANSAGLLRYQWQFNDAPIPGATNALLTLLSVNANQAGAYRVLVSNPAGSASSQAAVLTVTEQTALLELSAPRSTARGFEFRIAASPGRTYAVETSTNLLSWAPAASVTMDSSGATLFLDSAATNRPRGFYRVKAAE